MTPTPETAGRVIRAWMAVEALTPQGVKSDWGSLAAEKGGQQRNLGGPDGPAQWEPPGDGDPTPWPLLGTAAGRPEAPPAEAPDEAAPRRWHVVVLAALPARQAFARLDAAFADAPDEGAANSRADGNILAATAVLDEWGAAVPDSLAIASFAWGLGQVLRDGPAAGLAGWSEAEPGLRQRFGGNLAPTGPGGVPRSLTWRDLRAASLGMAEALGLPPELWQVTPCAIEVVSKDPPRPDLLSSFLLPDLARVLAALLEGVDGLSAAAASYPWPLPAGAGMGRAGPGQLATAGGAAAAGAVPAGAVAGAGAASADAAAVGGGQCGRARPRPGGGPGRGVSRPGGDQRAARHGEDHAAAGPGGACDGVARRAAGGA